jgi:hypothetical protein
MQTPVAKACQCPVVALDRSLTANYQLIFYGRVVDVHACGDRPGEAVFEIRELYQGNSVPTFTIVYDCKDACYLPFNKGDEWLIYTNYRQMGNGRMDWCSRSRKMMSVQKEDFYTVNYGTTFDDDIRFLRDSLGIHRTASNDLVNAGPRNQHPDLYSTAMMLLLSLAGMVGFYVLIRRLLFKKG